MNERFHPTPQLKISDSNSSYLLGTKFITLGSSFLINEVSYLQGLLYLENSKKFIKHNSS